MFDLQGYGGVLLDGVLITIQLGLISLIFGLIFGLLGAAARSSKLKIVQMVGGFYTTVVRGIPELLFVLFVFFGSDLMYKTVMKSLGHTQYVEIGAFWAGVTALSVMFGAYAAEVFRMALREIPIGQWEASQSLGMRPVQTFFRIILPQMWIVALPGLGNLTLVLLKDTALVSLIGLQDLMFFAQRAAQSTQQPFTFYMVAALMYLVLTIVVMAMIALAEYWVNPAKRHAKKQAKLSREGCV